MFWHAFLPFFYADSAWQKFSPLRKKDKSPLRAIAILVFRMYIVLLKRCFLIRILLRYEILILMFFVIDRFLMRFSIYNRVGL